MVEKYIYSHNEKLKYLKEEELKYRGILVEPLFMEKATWYVMLFIYCIWIRKNEDMFNISFSDAIKGHLPYSPGIYLWILIYVVIIFTGIKLIIKTVQLYAISSTSNNETEFLIKKKIFKKWSTYILNVVFSISLINYINGGGVFLTLDIGVYTWFNILMIVTFIKIIVKLLGLLISKVRIAMISGSLEECIKEVEDNDFEKTKDAIAQLIGNGEDIEVVWGLGFKNILMDIVKLFENIEEATIKEKELYQNKNHLITNLSHDLKTPLTSIINSTYILKNDKLSEEETKEQIEILEKKFDRLNTLIKDLNETVDTKYEGLVVNKKVVNIKQLIEDELILYNDKFKRYNLDIKIKYPSEDVNLFLDEEKTIRIIDNIFSNIIKYSLEDTRVYIDVVENEESIEITFKNISKYNIEVDTNTIGERFVQGDKSRHIEGNGLGISIVKSLVSIQGGNVKIDISGDLFKLILRFKK